MGLEKEITPPEVYFNRRAIMRGGIAVATAGVTALLYRKLNGVDLVESTTKRLAGVVPAPRDARGYWVKDELTPLASVTNYNNFYEFTTDKDGVAAASKNFKTDGWKVEVGGLCHAPTTFDLDDFRNLAPTEERVYRLRCVEAWSMVVPWNGFSTASCSTGCGRSPARSTCLRDALRPEAVSEPAGRERAAVAVRRGPPPRRGDAPARDVRDPVSTDTSCRRRMARRSSSWCRGSTASRASSRSSRSRDRPRAPCTWQRAAPGRIRLLREREPGASASAVEPGDGAAHRRVGSPEDAAVQRVWRAGGGPLRGHGPRCPLLRSSTAASSSAW